MKSNGYFPMFVDISQKKILVVGGGKIACRRVETLLSFGGKVTVVSPRIEPYLEEKEQKGEIQVFHRNYRKEDLQDMWMVLAATDHADLNEEIYQQARERGQLVNVASNRNLCDFQFPGIARKDPYVVGINAGGRDHRGVALLRKKIQEFLDKE